jgi:CheY-like chemotaxis protein
MRVMIVDDSRTARLMLKRLLPPSLLTDLIEVTGGNEALARCASEKIDLIFLDLTMPDRTGYEVLETLRDRGGAPVTVVISADGQSRAQERVQSLGAVAFMKKPPARADLERVLREAGLL